MHQSVGNVAGPGSKSIPILSLSAVCAVSLILVSCSVPAGYKKSESSWWPFATEWNPGATDPLHPHIHADKIVDNWLPDAGYTWNDKTKSLDVKWVSGLAHPDHAHVIASDIEGKWIPAAGYDWVASNSPDFAVKWVPGSRNKDFGHIFASAQEGYWTADPGYDWTDYAHSLNVAWKPYLLYPAHPHIYSFNKEGYWLAMPGYKFAVTGLEVASSDSVLDVVWNPGVTHPSCEWLTAAPEEGTWHLDSNFAFTNTDVNHLSFHRTEESAQDNKYVHLAFDFMAWLVGSSLGESSDNDSSTASAAKFGARAIADHAAVDGLSTAFSDPEAEQHTCDVDSKEWTRSFTEPDGA